MPQDKYGMELSVGDTVTVRCKIVHVDLVEQHARLSLEIIDADSPFHTIDSRKVIKEKRNANISRPR